MSDAGVEHIVLAVLAAIPGTIAALSSLKNGREQKRVRRELERVNGEPRVRPEKKNLDDGNTASNPDWYRAPKLWSN